MIETVLDHMTAKTKLGLSEFVEFERGTDEFSVACKNDRIARLFEPVIPANLPREVKGGWEGEGSTSLIQAFHSCGCLRIMIKLILL